MTFPAPLFFLAIEIYNLELIDREIASPTHKLDIALGRGIIFDDFQMVIH